jgi:hypothetical protein
MLALIRKNHRDLTSIESVENVLKNAPAQDLFDREHLREALRHIKDEAVVRDDQAQAKAAWCLEQVVDGHTLYIGAFDKMKNGNFYAAWCDLERIETILHHLIPHFRERFSEFCLDLIEKHVKQFQSLFPYKLFFSPEFVYEEMACTICHQPIKIRRLCEHRVGEIYDGEMCGREITKLGLCFGIGLVTNPVQKYSVVFHGDQGDGVNEPIKDTYEYGAVRYVIERLDAPFDDWTCEWTRTRHPHEQFQHVSRNRLCPCESGKKYKFCCLRESGVLRPHIEVVFEKMPSLPNPIAYF